MEKATFYEKLYQGLLKQKFKSTPEDLSEDDLQLDTNMGEGNALLETINLIAEKKTRKKHYIPNFLENTISKDQFIMDYKKFDYFSEQTFFKYYMTYLYLVTILDTEEFSDSDYVKKVDLFDSMMVDFRKYCPGTKGSGLVNGYIIFVFFNSKKANYFINYRLDDFFKRKILKPRTIIPVAIDVSNELIKMPPKSLLKNKYIAKLDIGKLHKEIFGE